MYKFAVLFALVACVAASPEPKPGHLVGLPVLQAAPAATSYANSYKVTYKSPVLQQAAIVAPVAPVVATHAVHPVAYAAPAYAAPAYAHLAYAAHPAVAIHP